MILSFSLTFVSSRSSSQKVAMVACVLLPPRSLHFLISIYNSFGTSHDCKQHRGLNIDGLVQLIVCDQDQYFGSVFAQKGLEFNKIHCVCSALCRIWTRQFIGYIYT